MPMVRCPLHNAKCTAIYRVTYHMHGIPRDGGNHKILRVNFTQFFSPSPPVANVTSLTATIFCRLFITIFIFYIVNNRTDLKWRLLRSFTFWSQVLENPTQKNLGKIHTPPVKIVMTVNEWRFTHSFSYFVTWKGEFNTQCSYNLCSVQSN